jgi:acylphosphatase
MKTGKDIYSEYKMQISAYRQALSENGASVEKAGIVLLKEDGSFVFAEMQEEKEAFKAFLNALELWRFLNEKKEVSNGKSSELGKEAE